jgi:D-3-phosphoglycerate dehydrogenase / 2-oxoglutarate reductase
MKIVIPDDYQDAVRSLDSFNKLAGQQVTIYRDSVTDIELLASRFQEAEALVLIRERTAITEPLLARLPKLKLLVQTGRGIPHIDVAACTRHGVAVAVGGGTPYATAELTWGLILAAMRHIPQEVANMKAGRWQSTLGLGLHGRTLGIFGYGNIGSVVANYGRAFGMKVLVWGREGSLARARADGFVTAADQDALFRDADILSLHIKLVQETRGIVTAADLAKMKSSALLVNTSRADLIERGVLEAALRAGHPGFAAVDVYEAEPVADHPLLRLDNVVCTPHLGYVEKDNYELYFGTAFDQVLAFAAGKPVDIVNPQVKGSHH